MIVQLFLDNIFICVSTPIDSAQNPSHVNPAHVSVVFPVGLSKGDKKRLTKELAEIATSVIFIENQPAPATKKAHISTTHS
jgi:hypothetical protein